ncbi:MAG: 5'-nucleotidase C-terminal domain-containing protein, partial [Bacilli bacterium]|nr:5'-nucleotidase C-terminal domain-containing protein [Bacilli bacterium]
TGQAILDALEFGVSKLPSTSGGFPQVSGITYDIDTSINSSVLTDENGIFINVTGPRRVSNVKINGVDIDLDKTYNASLIEFIASGGDGYSMFAKFEVSNESLVTDTDAFGMYIQNTLNGEIPEKYKDLEGRINIDNTNSNSSDDIAIIHVNDVHCSLNDTIGYDGYALYRDELKKIYKNVITVDVGDHVQGGTLGAISEGEAIIKILNKIGFDVAILGNHEFDYGIEQLAKLGNNITSKYICANFCYKKNKTTIFNPYKIIERGGKKIAFIGVVTPLTFSKTYISTLRDENGEAIYDFLAGNNTQDLYDAVQKYINEVREKEVDYVILLTHLGMSIEQYTSDGLLSKLEGVDAVLDGHTHKVYNVTSKDKNNNDIHITQVGTKLEQVGKFILKTDGSIISEIISEIPEPNNKTDAKSIFRAKKDRWVNKEMSEFIDDIWNEYADELNIEIGHSDIDFIIRPENTSDSHLIYCRYKECTLGNLITDAIREAGNGEITIINGGSVRNNMYKGDLSRGEVIDVLPWFNNIVVKQLTGQAILDALEHGVAKLPSSSGGFPQVSGITFDIDTSINSSVLTDENGMFINVTGPRRVSNVKINGVDLDLDKTYNASLLEFTANGGDGYSMLAKFEVINESLVTDTDAFALYIKYSLNGEIPEKYRDLEGRINIHDYESYQTNPTTHLVYQTNPSTY